MQYYCELTANFFWTAEVVAVDRLPWLMMLQVSFVLRASPRAHGSARCHNNTHAYFVSRWEKEAERDDYFRTAPTENSGPKFKFRLLPSLVKLLTFQNFKPNRVNKSEMLQKFSQFQGTIFHSSACISSSESFFKNRSAHFCGKSPSSGEWRLSTTNSNTLIPGAENSHGVKTDLHLRRPEFLRLPAGFRKPFQLTETRGFADHFLKISRSYSWGNLNYSNFSRAEPIGQLCCLAPCVFVHLAVCQPATAEHVGFHLPRHCWSSDTKENERLLWMIVFCVAKSQSQTVPNGCEPHYPRWWLFKTMPNGCEPHYPRWWLLKTSNKSAYEGI